MSGHRYTNSTFATLLQPTDSESKRLFGEAFAVASVGMTYRLIDYRTSAVEDFD